MLGLVEQTILLLLRDDGAFRRVSTSSQRLAIAGAVLMELADADRIEADLRHLSVVDATPTGDRLLDPTLAEIAADEGRSTRHWIEYVARRADVVRAGALGRLIGKGVLTERNRRVLWVFRARRYPVVDGQVKRELKLRITEVLSSGDTAGPRDVMLICLAEACGMFRTPPSKWRLRTSTRRIKQIVSRDPIGQTVVQAIADVRLAASVGAPNG